MQETEETWVQSLGREDAQEESMATHSSVLAWRIPWTGEPGGPHDRSDLAAPVEGIYCHCRSAEFVSDAFAVLFQETASSIQPLTA